MKLYNTLTRKLEEFKSIKSGRVGMYTCGPTVYDYQTIGNFRTMTLSDILSRVLRYVGYEVKTVRNITDIDDKIIKNAAAKKIPIAEFTKEFTKIFFEDLEKLNILPVDVTTYATAYVPKMIEYIKILIDKGYAYVEPDGSVYFEVSKFSDYGKLSGLDVTTLKTGTRMLSDEYDKENVADFALWKSVKPEEAEGYESPWSRGRPGWHIECSVMSQDNLGETFDIHVGGRDLKFPHHENEIAQSEAKTGKPFVNNWVHGEFLMVDGKKMSKSLKNFYTLRDLEEKGFDPIALRYFYLSAHYRTILNFTWEALDGAQTALNRLRERVRNLKGDPNWQIGCAGCEAEFLEALNDDLNLPAALAIVWKMLDDKELKDKAKLVSILRFDRVLGLDVQKELKEKVIPPEISALMEERNKLRAEKKFDQADEIRKKIEDLGYKVEDQKL